MRLSGDHDLSTKPQLLDALAGVRRASGIVIDLTRCTFVDSTIIAAILHAVHGRSDKDPIVSVLLPSGTATSIARFQSPHRDLLPASHPVEAARRSEPGNRPDD